jgi:hypothetical protein
MLHGIFFASGFRRHGLHPGEVSPLVFSMEVQGPVFTPYPD